MFNNNQNTNLSIHAPIPIDVFCKYCETKMIQLNKNGSVPSLVCPRCGGTLIIQTEEASYKLTESSRQCYPKAIKIIWDKCKDVI